MNRTDRKPGSREGKIARGCQEDRTTDGKHPRSIEFGSGVNETAADSRAGEPAAEAGDHLPESSPGSDVDVGSVAQDPEAVGGGSGRTNGRSL